MWDKQECEKGLNQVDKEQTVNINQILILMQTI